MSASLLVVDVGNTNTVLGLYEGKTLANDWRLATRREATADEIGILLTGLLGPAPPPVARAIVATVVPVEDRVPEVSPSRRDVRRARHPHGHADPL